MMQIKESKSHQGGHSLSRIFREPENKDSNAETKDLNVIVNVVFISTGG
jgi:hypothetical protein